MSADNKPSLAAGEAKLFPVVETAEGKVRGLRSGRIAVFKGLRYGADTSGANRFRAPQPVHPWAGVRDALDYAASFRTKWNVETEAGLLDRFRLDVRKPVTGLSKGQRTQLALIGAICADPELLILDEPTSGLDPIVRREFIEAVIGAYQDADPGRRTVFVSTHLITEFEGLIDRFTIVEGGKATVSLDADEARSKYRRLTPAAGLRYCPRRHRCR